MATVQQSRNDRYERYLESSLYNRVQRIISEFGYGLAFQDGDSVKLEVVLDLLVKSGFLYDSISDQPKEEVHQVWLIQMGQRIYQPVGPEQWSFEQLLVDQEYVNVYYQCKKSSRLKTYVIKGAEALSEERREKLELRCDQVGKLHSLSWAAKAIIENNGLNDPNFQTRFTLFVNVISGYFNVQFGVEFTPNLKEIADMVKLTNSLMKDAKLKEEHSKALEAAKTDNKDDQEEYKQQRRKNTSYVNAVKWLNSIMIQLNDLTKNMTSKNLTSLTYEDSVTTTSQSIVSARKGKSNSRFGRQVPTYRVDITDRQQQKLENDSENIDEEEDNDNQVSMQSPSRQGNFKFNLSKDSRKSRRRNSRSRSKSRVRKGNMGGGKSPPQNERNNNNSNSNNNDNGNVNLMQNLFDGDEHDTKSQEKFEQEQYQREATYEQRFQDLFDENRQLRLESEKRLTELQKKFELAQEQLKLQQQDYQQLQDQQKQQFERFSNELSMSRSEIKKQKEEYNRLNKDFRERQEKQQYRGTSQNQATNRFEFETRFASPFRNDKEKRDSRLNRNGDFANDNFQTRNYSESNNNNNNGMFQNTRQERRQRVNQNGGLAYHITTFPNSQFYNDDYGFSDISDNDSNNDNGDSFQRTNNNRDNRRNNRNSSAGNNNNRSNRNSGDNGNNNNNNGNANNDDINGRNNRNNNNRNNRNNNNGNNNNNTQNRGNRQTFQVQQGYQRRPLRSTTQMAQSEIQKMEIKSMFNFSSKLHGTEKDIFGAVSKFVEDVLSWWRVYENSIEQDVAIRHLLANNLQDLAKTQALDENDLQPFRTVRELLQWLLSNFSGDEYYKNKEAQLLNWEYVDQVKLSQVVGVWNHKVKEYHQAIRLSQLSENMRRQRLWSSNKQFDELLKRLPVELKHEMIVNYGQPNDMNELRTTLVRMEKANNWVKGTSREVIDRPDMTGAGINKIDLQDDFDVNYTRFDSNYSRNYNYRARGRGGSRFGRNRDNAGGGSRKGRDFTSSSKNYGIKEFDPEFGRNVDHSNDRMLPNGNRCYRCNSRWHYLQNCNASLEVIEKYNQFQRRTIERLTSNKKGYGGRPYPRGGGRSRGRGRGRNGRGRGRTRRRGYRWQGKDNPSINKVSMDENSKETEKEEKSNHDYYSKLKDGDIYAYKTNAVMIEDQEIDMLEDGDFDVLKINAVQKAQKLKLAKTVSAGALIKDVESGYREEDIEKERIWLIYGKLIDNKFGQIELLMQGDTGAQALCVDYDLAHAYFKHKLERILTPKRARMANSQIIKIDERMLITWRTYYDTIFNAYMYLIKNLNVPMIASLKFLRKLGFNVQGRRPVSYILPNNDPLLSEKIINYNHKDLREVVHHPAEDDIDLTNIEKHTKQRIKISPKNVKTPRVALMDAKINSITPVLDDGNLTDFVVNGISAVRACEAVKIGDKIVDQRVVAKEEISPVIIDKFEKIEEKFNVELLPDMFDDDGKMSVNFISRFEATEIEIDKAMKLCDDKTYGKLNVRLVEDYFKDKNFAKSIETMFINNPNVVAQGRYSIGKIKDCIYHLNVKKEHLNKVVYTNQYHLNSEKRLAYIYDTVKKLRSGIYEKDIDSPHNIPVIMIAKTVTRKDGTKFKRYRTAHDFSKLNQYLEDIQTIVPTQPVINSVLAKRGPVMLFDINGCFENFVLANGDRKWTRSLSPVGPVRLTRASYGLKNIMALVQAYNHKKFVIGFKDLADVIIFVDDGVIKLREGITKAEFYTIVERFIKILNDTGYKINLAKLFLIVTCYIFVGICHSEAGHRPTEDYIQKCLKLDVPATDRDAKCITASMRVFNNYIYNFSGVMEPIQRLESKSKVKEWGPEQFAAFDVIKKKIENCFVLKYPTLDGEMMLHTDACGTAHAAIYFQLQYDPIKGKQTYKIVRFHSGQFPKSMRPYHSNFKEFYAGVDAMVKGADLLLKKRFTWLTDNFASKYLVDNRAVVMCQNPVIQRLRLEIAPYIFDMAHASANWLVIVDMLNRVGEQSQHQHAREREKAKKLRMKFGNATNISLVEFFNDCHEFNDSIDIGDDIPLEINQLEFKTNDEYYDHVRSMIALREMNEGNLDIVMNGIDFSKSYDNSILVNNMRFDAGTTLLLRNYHFYTRNHLNNLELSRVNKFNGELINSVINSNVTRINGIDMEGYLESEYFDYKKQTLEGIVSKLSNPLAIWLGFKQHGRKFTPEANVSYKKNPIRKSNNNELNVKMVQFDLSNKFEEVQTSNINRLQFDLTGQFNQSPFNFSSQYPRSILKNGKRLIPSSLKVTNITEQQLDKNLEQAKVNAFRNYFACCRNNFDSTASILINSCQVFRAEPALLLNSTSLPRRSPRLAAKRKEKEKRERKEKERKEKVKKELKLPRRSPRLAAKPRVLYHGMDDRVVEERESKYDGYSVGIPSSLDVSSTKFKIFFRKLANKYSLESSKKIFDFEKLRAAQQLDTKIRIMYDYIESGDKDILLNYDEDCDSCWKFGAAKDYFMIDDGILFYNDGKNELTFENGRIVVPDVFKIPLIKYFHISLHHNHSGSQILLAYLQSRFWWVGMDPDVKFVVNSCDNCNSAKGKCDTLELNPWFTQNTGELLIYDFAGPYFNSIYISCFMDDFSGKCQLRVVVKCDAMVVCNLFLNHWVVEHGFPIQMIGDLGSSNFNELVFIIQEMSGVDGLYASPRRHQSIGKVERLIQEMNKHFRQLNIDLDGSITDIDINQAIFEIQQFLPSIQLCLNATVSSTTGFSPDMLDKGKQLRGITDVPLALKKLKERIKKGGISKLEQVKYLNDLQRQLYLYQQQKNNKQLSYILRNCNRHNEKVKQKNYRKGEFVGFYVGNCNKDLRKWQARYHKSIFIKNLNNGQVQIRDLVDNKIKTVSKGLIKSFVVNDSLWKTELAYNEMVKQREETKQKRKVQFRDW